MKKSLFVLSVLFLLAAGCNSSQEAYMQTPSVENNNPAPVTQDQTPPANPSPTPTPTPTPATSTTPSPAPAKPPVQVTVALKLGSDASLGQYLTASNGMTLYTSGNDSANTSNCTGACASNWPPYTQSATLKLAGATGISGAVSTMTRADGSTQVTYKGMPLYFWIQDKKAGDTTGNQVGGFVVAKP